MSLVLDASATIARFHSKECTESPVVLFDHIARNGAVAPPLWKIEVANVLRSKVRRKEYDGAERDAILADIAGQRVTLDLNSLDQTWSRTVELSDHHDLTVYDATYLEVALRLRLPLATLDQQLRMAASREGVPLLGL